MKTLKMPRSTRPPATAGSTSWRAAAVATDHGWAGIAWSDDGFERITIGHPSAAAAMKAADGASSEPPPQVAALARKLQAHAAGQDVDFDDVELNLGRLTPFQQRVIAICRALKPGQTLSYGEVAERAGAPGAARAVGSVMRQNRFPVVVPCHRIVGASGSLGGFSAPEGPALKLRMLKREGWTPRSSVAKKHLRRSSVRIRRDDIWPVITR